MSPTAHRRLIRVVADAEGSYRAARSAALETFAAYRRDRTGPRLLAVEDSLGAALEARSWMFEVRRRLAAAIVVPFGGRLSPAALARRQGGLP